MASKASRHALITRHAIVTGGGTGVGKAIALSLLAEGFSVSICGRRQEPLDAMVSADQRIFAKTADVTDQTSIERFYEAAEARHGPVDIVVANAGNAVTTPAAKLTLAGWNAMLTLNLTGAFLTVQPALAAMAQRKTGRIVFIASTAGLKGYPYTAAYCAAKHGVIGLMRALALETAKSGVTVNAICPGFTETDMLDASIAAVAAKTGRPSQEIAQSFAAANPQARFIKPEEIAAAVRWLVSDAACSVTGQAISVSGGETW